MKLFTPGPLNTSNEVRRAMNQDIGSRTGVLSKLTKDICYGLMDIAQCGSDYTCVLLQGSGTFAIEAMITSFISNQEAVLVVSNGLYGERIAQICVIHNIKHYVLKMNPLCAINLSTVENFLLQNKDIKYIVTVQFETAIGVLNDIDGLISIATNFGCRVLVDAMSSFAALPLNYYAESLVAVASSANKCLHGVPGISFVLIRRNIIAKCNNRRTLSLDLCEQWKEFELNEQWRFTPPTHVLMALKVAILELKKLGGQKARLKRYTTLANQLVTSFAEIGIFPVVEECYRAPIIITFELRNQLNINANYLIDKLFKMGLVLYPSKLSNNNTFRVGCIGEINESDIDMLVLSIKKVIS